MDWSRVGKDKAAGNKSREGCCFVKNADLGARLSILAACQNHLGKLFNLYGYLSPIPEPLNQSLCVLTVLSLKRSTSDSGVQPGGRTAGLNWTNLVQSRAQSSSCCIWNVGHTQPGPVGTLVPGGEGTFKTSLRSGCSSIFSKFRDECGVQRWAAWWRT